MSKFFTKKRIGWFVAIVVVGSFGYAVFAHKGAAIQIQTDIVKRQDLQQTVLSTGQVVSRVDLNLSFQGSGVVRQVRVQEGDQVKSGQLLAVLDQAAVRANLTSAQGALAQAQATYEKVLAGSTNQQIEVSQAAVQAAQVTLDNTKRSYEQTQAQQDLAVQNAYKVLLNTGLAAIPGPSSLSPSSAPTISGTYTGSQSTQYKISLYESGSGLHYVVSGSESAEGPLNTGVPLPLGTQGLYMVFPISGSFYSSDNWTVDIPNMRASAYVTNQSAYQAAVQGEAQALATAQNAIEAAQAGLGQARANLDQTLAKATSADLDAARAQILSAQGQVQAARAAEGNTLLVAPADGTITNVNVKVGEQASALQAVMVLQNVQDLHAEADVSEANVASLKPGQSVDYTFDALGPDRHFTGVVESVNPASTVISGVVNYKVRSTIEHAPDIKPGMTANMTVLVAKKSRVLAVPARALLNQDGKQEVRVIDDAAKKTFHPVAVQTGLQADGGLVEILSGLTEGQEIVTFLQP